jgi:hypothetical protein
MITEFDMNNDHKRAQADFLRDFYTACFSHPRVRGIVQWGFWKAHMWQPRGHAFGKNWEETAVARSYEERVLHDWWTRESGQTDTDGQFAIRAFQGVQTVTVNRDGYSWVGDVALEERDREIEVVVP